MKKIVFAMAVMTVAVAGVATASSHRKVTDEQVESAIDARLHQMLVKLNAEKK
ncbi:MAG: hypothetical protein ACO1OB_15540 [Archangium sp.]